MTKRIVHQGPGYEVAVTDEAHTAVPYPAVDHPDGSKNLGFQPLVDYPEMVAEIEEAKKSAGLAELLRAVNERGSPVMSIGCECSLFPVDVPATGEPSWYVRSYASVTYRDSSLSSNSEAMVALAEELLRRTPPPPGNHLVGYEMVVEPLKLFFGHEGHFELTMHPVGFGHTQAEAWEAFGEAALALATAFRALQQQ